MNPNSRVRHHEDFLLLRLLLSPSHLRQEFVGRQASARRMESLRNGEGRAVF